MVFARIEIKRGPGLDTPENHRLLDQRKTPTRLKHTRMIHPTPKSESASQQIANTH